MNEWNQLMTLPLVGDGAVGTRLAQLHPEVSGPPEAFNLSHPQWVKGVHEEYMRAGAALHRTNTRHANSVGLAAQGLADRCEAVNNSASALVRDVVGHDAPVMGVIGQILPDKDGALASDAERQRAYSEQLVYLADTGATFIGLEHFSSVEEALLVLRIARSAADAPVLAHLALDAQGRTAEGMGCDEAAKRLAGGGAEALGLSCGPGPRRLPALVEALLIHGLPVSVMLGVRTGDFPPPYADAAALSPERFAAALIDMAGRGAAIVGGCCGATPDHIRALADLEAGVANGGAVTGGGAVEPGE